MNSKASKGDSKKDNFESRIKILSQWFYVNWLSLILRKTSYMFCNRDENNDIQFVSVWKK